MFLGSWTTTTRSSKAEQRRPKQQKRFRWTELFQICSKCHKSLGLSCLFMIFHFKPCSFNFISGHAGCRKYCWNSKVIPSLTSWTEQSWTSSVDFEFFGMLWPIKTRCASSPKDDLVPRGKCLFLVQQNCPRILQTSNVSEPKWIVNERVPC